MQVDPFFVPVTEEDREEFGEEGQGVGACTSRAIHMEEHAVGSWVLCHVVEVGSC